MLLLQNQEYRVSYASTAARVCFLSGSLVSYLIYTYFSSDLTATLTTASNIPPIKNFQERMILWSKSTILSNPELIEEALFPGRHGQGVQGGDEGLERQPRVAQDGGGRQPHAKILPGLHARQPWDQIQ